MRIAFFLLLFANLVFLAWAEWIDVPQPAPSNDLYTKLPRLKLVGEEPSHNNRPSSRGGSARKTAMESPAPTAAARCISVGPFDAESAVTGEASLLREKGLSARQRSHESEVSKGFWVYIGGLKSDHDVTQVMRTLQQSHVDDAKVMQDSGDDTHRVSVGFFSDRERADRRAASLKKLGLEPEVGERKVPGTVFWLDVEVPPGAAVPTAQELTGGGATTATAPVEVAPCPLSPSGDGTAPLPAAPSGAPFRTKVATGTSKVP
ncbi:MAG TPA: SPOR domain-containing protein [Steroidobacteraceae bacterium]